MPESKVRKGASGVGRGLVRESKDSAVLEQSFLAESFAYFCAQTHRHALTHTHAHRLSALNVSVYVQREKGRDRGQERERERGRHSRTFSLPSHMYEISRFAWDLLECACVCMCACVRVCMCECVRLLPYFMLYMSLFHLSVPIFVLLLQK